MTTIFDPLKMGSLDLENRIFMAPLTRARADEGAVPGDMIAQHYAQRADAGLIIAEATAISPMGYGWKDTPGIWNDEQVKGWKKTTDAVHSRGGKIFLQIWHTGRVSHPDFLNGETPVGPSAIAAEGKAYTPTGTKPFVTPRELTKEEIKGVIADYAAAAKRAMAAGFDGVELHAANGYLIDQFMQDNANKRTDEYGGSLDNRLRFLVETTKAVAEAIGPDKVGVRLSPNSSYNDMRGRNQRETFTRAAEVLSPLGLAYLHVLEPLPKDLKTDFNERATPHMRKAFKGVLIASGGYDAAKANAALAAGEADAIAFGTLYIANPDLVTRFQKAASLNEPDKSTYYTRGAEGYNDYPRLDDKALAVPEKKRAPRM